MVYGCVWGLRIVDWRLLIEELTANYANSAKGFRIMFFTVEDYQQAIEYLQLGLKQLKPDGNCCLICGDNDHQAFECRFNPLIWKEKSEKLENTWRCFHCNFVTSDRELARKHFGNISPATPRCIFDKCLCHDCSCNPTECSGKA